MARDPSMEWHVDPASFPTGGSDAEKLRFLVRYAILAPSGHNTQPWLFRLGTRHLDVLGDRTRTLAVVDPHDRALVISCGAAVGALRTASRHFGRECAVELLPDDDNDVYARVVLGAAHAPTLSEEARFSAIMHRRSTRFAYTDEPLPEGLTGRLSGLAAQDGVELAIATDPTVKEVIAGLVAEGDRAQFADPRFRRELAAWVHSRRAASRDGMSGASFGMPDMLSGIGALVIRTFDMGGGIAAKDRDIALSSPALAVVATPGDRPADWMRAGMAHMEVLLEVTAAGLTAAYLNQPVEVEALRPRLRSAAATAGVPQLLLRIGRGPEVPPTVRRHVEDVIVG